MEYVDLKRNFLPIKKDEEIDVELARVWGRRIGGWLDWDDLLNKKRVVLLAEALSGKTEEFEYNCQKLLHAGKAAFFIRIEELADEGFEQSLDLNAISIFEEWRKGFEEGYFFLDSIDEARLNRKRFDSALKKLAKNISHSLNRSRIFISCRVTDWKGTEDEQTIKQLLPVPVEVLQHPSPVDSEAALLDPIFVNERKNSGGNQGSEDPISDFIVVRLAPLDEKQQGELAKEVGVENILEFCQSIWQNGLENLAERPGDLIALAKFWKNYRKFGTLSEMTDYAVEQKLSEQDPYRPDNHILTPQKACEGAERIAAALTLGKTFTLCTPGQGPDPELTAGALEPRTILKEWSDAERNALLRRGIFAPATYGRVRFHQRSTQEYLAARWVNQLLQKGCPPSEVFKVLFTEVYGVKTVVPSLRAIAAWLAVAHENNDIRNEILNRDPLILIQNGDPGSLSVETRRRLLQAYAEKHESGDISNDSLDHRALWMFSHPDLAETIREIWDSCTRYDFRGDLLRLIREGAIKGCDDLVSQVALDQEENISHRIIAVQALNKFKNSAVLSCIADNLIKEAGTTTTRLASSFACELFPSYLSIDQLITLITNTQDPEKESNEEFGYVLQQLWEKCLSEWRDQFVETVAKLTLSKPFVDAYRRVSQKYGYIAKYFEPVARQLTEELGGKEPNVGMIYFLMAYERVDHSYIFQEDKPPISQLVQSHPKLQRALFWADVEEVRENKGEDKSVTFYWQINFHGSMLWKLGPSDLTWLYHDLVNCSFIDDKRIALSAIVHILQSEGTLEKKKAFLKGEVQPFPVLMEDLGNYLKPHDESEYEIENRLRRKQSKIERAERKIKDKDSWIKFKDELIANPSLVVTPDERLRCIKNLTWWLRSRTSQGAEKAARQWRLIEEAFDSEVATSYQNAMKALWRDTKPERPRRRGNQITTKWSNFYAYAGVGVEADGNLLWATQLTKEEAELAAKHGCMSEQGYPDWLDNLIDGHPDVVIPVVKKAFRREWKSEGDGRLDLINHFGNVSFPQNTKIAPALFEIIIRSKPLTSNMMKYGLEIIQHMELSGKQMKRLKNLAIISFEQTIEQGEVEFALIYLELLFYVDQQTALQWLKKWIKTAGSEEQNQIALQVFGVLFNNNYSGMISASLNSAPVETLKELVLVAYLYVHPNDDNNHKGTYTPDPRDDAARGRNNVMSALRNAKGVYAYEAMNELANTPELAEYSHRFRQLARGMAERDAESLPWTEDETITFEKVHIAPIKNGDDLYRVVLVVLDNIRHQLVHGDVSSKRLLSKLAEIDKDDEESVQGWLAEQLSLRANGKYQIYRETEVANKDKPDIIVSGATALVEVAIEVKQADSWSPNELKDALTQQLTEDYLKPQIRRHGVLFMTDHGRRKWRHPITRKQLSFDGLLASLSETANSIEKNSTGKVEVSVCGIDATV